MRVFNEIMAIVFGLTLMAFFALAVMACHREPGMIDKYGTVKPTIHPDDPWYCAGHEVVVK